MNRTLSFDLCDDDGFDSERDRELAGLEVAATLFIDTVAVLKAPTPTETAVSEVLDFFGPLGAARACFYAVKLLEAGRLGVDADEEFDVVAGRVRHQCRQMIARGRVKAAGQPRQRHAKPAPAGQGCLFGEA